MGLARNKLFGAVSPLLLSKLSVLTDDLKIPIKWTTKMWAMANNSNFVNESVIYQKFIALKVHRWLMDSTEVEQKAYQVHGQHD